MGCAKCLIELLLEDGGDAISSLLEETFGKISSMLQLISPTTFLIVDSTPLVDLYDMEAGWGHTSRGKFRGFKLHAAVNQLRIALESSRYAW